MPPCELRLAPSRHLLVVFGGPQVRSCCVFVFAVGIVVAVFGREQVPASCITDWYMGNGRQQCALPVLLVSTLISIRCSTLDAPQGLEHALQQDGVAAQHSSPAELFDR